MAISSKTDSEHGGTKLLRRWSGDLENREKPENRENHGGVGKIGKTAGAGKVLLS